jgi:hypothetical protein
MKYARPLILGDIEYIAANMRHEDVEEAAALGSMPLDALRTSCDVSNVLYTLVDPDGKPAALLGVAPGSYPRFGAIWMLGTPSIEQYRMTFLKNCKLAMPTLFEESGSDALYNYTYSGNPVHHSWLQWMGFTFIRKVSLPPHNKDFYEFVKLRG